MTNIIDGQYRYYAFISYKREDEEWAKWLQHKLEHYRLPSNLNGRTDLPKEIRPVFKDTSELTPGNLPEQINQALEQSKFLIVICSPRSAQSEWVNKEVETFKSMGRTNNIIPFIIDGRPFSSDQTEECFPQAILSLPREQEILGANINEMGRDSAAVKVVARMFDIRFDELWHRHEREQKRRRRMVITSAIAAILFLSGVAFWMYVQRQTTLKANWRMMENQARMVAEKSKEEIRNGNTYDAIIALLEMMPDDGSRPYVPELEAALRMAYDSLQTRKWHYRHLGRYSEGISFSEDEEYLLAKDMHRIDIFETKTLNKISEIQLPDTLSSSRYESFFSANNDTVYHVVGENSLDCYETSSGKFIKRILFSDKHKNLWQRTIGNNLQYLATHWPWIQEWLDGLGLPQDVDILNYSHASNILLYRRNEGEVEIGTLYSLAIYDCNKKKELFAFGCNGEFFATYGHHVEDTAFSPDGRYLAVACSFNGMIVDLTNHSIRNFYCGNDCEGESNWILFGRNNQLLHSSRNESFVKHFDVRTLQPKDSIPVINCYEAEMNKRGDIWLLSDEQEWYAYRKREIKKNLTTMNRLEMASYLKGQGFKKIDWEWEGDTILNERFSVRENLGEIRVLDLKGEYKSQIIMNEKYESNIIGSFHNDKYLVILAGKREQYSMTDSKVLILDLASGIIVKQLDSGYNDIYYNKELEQLAVVEVTETIETIETIDFPTLPRLVQICRKETEGMKLTEMSRRKFYLD